MAQMKKPATPMPRATKRGTPVAMPSKPSKTATTPRPGPLQSRRVKSTVIPNLKPRGPLKPSSETQKQAKAMDDLMKKRAAAAKKTGKWPNYGTN